MHLRLHVTHADMTLEARHSISAMSASRLKDGKAIQSAPVQLSHHPKLCLAPNALSFPGSASIVRSVLVIIAVTQGSSMPRCYLLRLRLALPAMGSLSLCVAEIGKVIVGASAVTTTFLAKDIHAGVVILYTASRRQ